RLPPPALFVHGQFDLIALAGFAPIATDMALQESGRMFAGFRQFFHSTGRDGDLPQREPSAIEFSRQPQYRSSLVKELPVRAGLAERSDQSRSAERLNDSDFDGRPAGGASSS